MPDLPSYTAGQIAEVCGGRLADPARAGLPIRAVGTLEDAGPLEVSWITAKEHAVALRGCRAAAIIGTEQLLCGDARGILVADPEAALANVLDRFLIQPERPEIGRHPSAVIHPTAQLGENVAIGACAVIHAGTTVGDGTVIHEGVSLGRGVRVGRACEIYDHCVIYDRCRLGDRVILHAGVVVGADGFGYIFREGLHRKLAHLGTVVIEDDVEIGANACVDRAKVGATIVGRGSKIDNLVMIAHNCRIGPLCLLAGQVGLAGSVRLGVGVALGGQAGVVDGMTLGDGVRVACQTGVIGDIPSGQVIMGFPARERMSVLRDQARIRKLPKLTVEIAELRRRVEELEAAADHRRSGRS